MSDQLHLTRGAHSRRVRPGDRDPSADIFSVERPWGDFQQFVSNETVTVKIITVQPGHRLSLQRHEHRGEMWQVLDGPIDITVDDRQWRAERGETSGCPRARPTGWATAAASPAVCSRSPSATSTRPTSSASRTTTPAEWAPRADHATVSSPSRHRRGPSSTGQPSSRSAVHVGEPPLPHAERRPAARHAARPGRAPRGTSCTGSPGTLRWMSALGSRSATSDGRSSPRSRSETVRLTGPAASTATHEARRPSSSQVPVDEQAVRGQPRRDERPGGRHLVLGVLAQHVEGPHHGRARRRPGSGTSKPPSAKRSPGRSSRAAGRHPGRVDLDADHLARRGARGRAGRAARAP